MIYLQDYGGSESPANDDFIVEPVLEFRLEDRQGLLDLATETLGPDAGVTDLIAHWVQVCLEIAQHTHNETGD